MGVQNFIKKILMVNKKCPFFKDEEVNFTSCNQESIPADIVTLKSRRALAENRNCLHVCARIGVKIIIINVNLLHRQYEIESAFCAKPAAGKHRP